MSTIVTDTITGKSTATTITIGSTPVVSASANSMTIRGEGSNQTSIQQGLAKAWLRFNGQSTIAINDSHNVASLTDNETGNYDYNFTTNMASINYSATANAQDTTRRDGVHQSLEGQATTDVKIHHYENNTKTDAVRILSTTHGDLS